MNDFENKPTPNEIVPEGGFDVEMSGGGSMYQLIIEDTRARLQTEPRERSEWDWWDTQSKAWTKRGYEAFSRRYGIYKGFDEVMERVARDLSKETFDS